MLGMVLIFRALFKCDCMLNVPRIQLFEYFSVSGVKFVADK